MTAQSTTPIAQELRKAAEQLRLRGFSRYNIAPRLVADHPEFFRDTPATSRVAEARKLIGDTDL